jgi:hypothetical protein
MTLPKLLFSVCLIISVLCLAGGYGIAGRWIGVVTAIITSPTWLVARKHPATWLPFFCLIGSVSLAAIGLLKGSPVVLMICSSGFALAAWDLLLLNKVLRSNSSGEQNHLYEKKHVQSLALALGSGLVLAMLGRLVDLRISFSLMVFFIALVLYGLERVLVIITKAEHK